MSDMNIPPSPKPATATLPKSKYTQQPPGRINQPAPTVVKPAPHSATQDVPNAPARGSLAAPKTRSDFFGLGGGFEPQFSKPRKLPIELDLARKYHAIRQRDLEIQNGNAKLREQIEKLDRYKQEQ